jgi:hypothetical protein
MAEKREPETTEAPTVSELAEIDIGKISSPVLARLIEEIRNEESPTAAHTYNRTHNRHNRGR